MWLKNWKKLYQPQKRKYWSKICYATIKPYTEPTKQFLEERPIDRPYSSHRLDFNVSYKTITFFTLAKYKLKACCSKQEI